MAERKIKKRSDGRYRRYVIVGKDLETGAPVRQPVYGKTLAEVNTAVRELREQVARDEVVINRSTLLKDFADLWLDATISKGRKKSYESYKSAIESQIKPRLGEKKISEIKTIQIQKELTALEHEGKAKTAVLVRMTLIRIFKAALNERLVTVNPAAGTKKPYYQAKPKTPLSEHEIDLILAAPLESKEKLFVMMGLFQGLRKGEILGLKRVTGEKIRISQTWSCINNRPEIKESAKTRAGDRELSIMPQTAAALQEMQSEHRRMYIFSNEDGTLLTEEQYKKMWKRIMNAFNIAAGGQTPMGRRKEIRKVRTFTSHTLRHTFATMLYYAGFDILQAQYLLGQDDVKTTLEVYTHLDKTSLGNKDKYQKFKPILREIFLNEKRSKSVQTDNL